MIFNKPVTYSIQALLYNILLIIMKNYGLVSIITPSFNSAVFIAETIEAILNQTYPYWELLITDDCSTDNSVDIIDEYVRKDSRIKLQKLEINSGAGICRNRSIEMARGRYIAFCDSDDVWMSQKLEKQLAFMEKKKCALTYSSYMLMNEEGAEKGIVVCQSKLNYNQLKRDNEIGCLTAMYDTEKVGKMYMSSIRKRQDWGLWLEILAKCKVAYGIKEPLAYYRIRKGSISNKKMNLVKHNINVYRTILKFPVWKAYLFFSFVFMPTYMMKRFRMKMNNL